MCYKNSKPVPLLLTSNFFIGCQRLERGCTVQVLFSIRYLSRILYQKARVFVNDSDHIIFQMQIVWLRFQFVWYQVMMKEWYSLNVVLLPSVCTRQSPLTDGCDSETGCHMRKKYVSVILIRFIAVVTVKCLNLNDNCC